MTWNFRVIHSKLNGQDMYALHEVYYDEEGNIEMWTQDPLDCWEDLVDLEGTAKHVLNDIQKFPIVEASTLKDYKLDGGAQYMATLERDFLCKYVPVRLPGPEGNYIWTERRKTDEEEVRNAVQEAVRKAQEERRGERNDAV